MKDGPNATIDGHAPSSSSTKSADDQQRKENAPAVDDRGKAAVGGAYESRYAPKARLRHRVISACHPERNER